MFGQILLCLSAGYQMFLKGLQIGSICKFYFVFFLPYSYNEGQLYFATSIIFKYSAIFVKPHYKVWYLK